MNSANLIHTILIVGGGSAGLELATSLGRKLGKPGIAKIVLLDASQTHIWKPLLHEVAAGTLDASEELEYMAQAHRNHFHFRLGKMQGLDREKQEISVSPTFNDAGEELIPQRTFHYDTLVMAVGSISNTFNVEGVDQQCMFLDKVSEAFKFQKHLVEACIKLHAQHEHNNERQLSIAIIGGGATGVELAAQLYEVARVLAIYDMDEGVDKVKITIIEASPRLLAALPENLSIATQKQLVKLGVELRLNRRVIKITDNSIETQDGEIIPADLKVWAAGIKAPEWFKDLDGLEINRINQLVVSQSLQTTDAKIFALGDCAACPWPGHKENVPPRAQAAHQQATTLHKTLVNRMNNKPAIDYLYCDYGSLVSLGKYSTVGNMMGNLMGTVTIGGFIARIVYLSLYTMHQAALFGYFKTGMLTLSNLFRSTINSRIKLH
ncbi:MAG: NAD(P)/FAD-dependent oxidoreductase [Gammaproteobacteria bacterium]|jgi:NADH dehydrogenase|nr:NAD(P)/FAD-dependent oxidoreductase [Gammaproteobacteria bacterium]MBT5223555.1 NAD(P)/FAD-dependent oxidoreductase [Gammaproteobacteria bacterium]MBT5825849.1 NAD(P)/FAD-dependent oxidoreductase [Gammaproteobacteria bacterium]MBT5966048.1 NAD(P)/FAD-dependent oxidoreductase [Gammaproteobacteria bacterium]MBT6420965.1 NAD(P)/FAD-dependent oxidoreductase [Gammaproteobacteria bacterium]